MGFVFENYTFGECEIIASFKDVVIIELESNFEKYVVATHFDFYNKNWYSGYYFKDLKDAGKCFNSILEDFYMINFKI